MSQEKMHPEQPVSRLQGTTLLAKAHKPSKEGAGHPITMLSAGSQRAENISYKTRAEEGLSLFKRLTGQKIADKYYVTRIIKIGGMGLVVAARHQYLNKVVAVKFLLPSLTKKEEHLARFIREAQAAARLKSDHVARVMDVGRLPDGTPFVVMEYLEGLDLDDLLEQKSKLPASLAVDIVLQVSDAIGEAHSQGMVHRDLKPSNIFLTPRASGLYKAKVIDFGIVKANCASQPLGDESVITQTGHVLGTPFYMPPEQLRGCEALDQRADIWALGVVLYECLSGERPFDGNSLASLAINIVQEEPVRLERLQPDLPLGLGEIVHRCLKKDPAERYQSIEELRSVLLDFAVYESTVILRARRARSSHMPAPNSFGVELSSTGIHRRVPTHTAKSPSQRMSQTESAATLSADADIYGVDTQALDQGADIFAAPKSKRPSWPPVTSSAHIIQPAQPQRALSAAIICFAGAALMATLSFPQLTSSLSSSTPHQPATSNLAKALGHNLALPQLPKPQPSILTYRASNKPALLRICSQPMPDRIYVDGRLWRGSNGLVRVTPNVAHKIVLKKAGHDAVYVQVTLAAAERRALKLALPRVAASGSDNNSPNTLYTTRL